MHRHGVCKIMALTTVANVKEYAGITSDTDDALIENLITRVQKQIEVYCDRAFDSASYTQIYDGDSTTKIYLDEWPVTAVSRVAIGRQGAMQIYSSHSADFAVTAKVDDTNLTVTTYDKAATTASTSTLNAQDLDDIASDITAVSGFTATVLSDYGIWEGTELIKFTERGFKDGTLSLDVFDQRLHSYTVDLSVGSIYSSGGFPGGNQNVYVDYTAGYSTIPGDLEQIAIEIISNVMKSRSINTQLESEKIGDYSYKVAPTSSGVSSLIADKAYDLAPYKRMRYS